MPSFNCNILNPQSRCPVFAFSRLVPLSQATTTLYHQYAPLDEDAKEIRLLTLLSEEFSPEIRVLIHTTTLEVDNRTLFEALSYAWGSTEDPKTKVGLSGNTTPHHAELVHLVALSSIQG